MPWTMSPVPLPWPSVPKYGSGCASPESLVAATSTRPGWLSFFRSSIAGSLAYSFAAGGEKSQYSRATDQRSAATMSASAAPNTRGVIAPRRNPSIAPAASATNKKLRQPPSTTSPAFAEVSCSAICGATEGS